MWKQYHLAIKGVRKGYLPANFFFFFFLVQAVGPWYGASATKPFWVPSRGSVQAYNEFKNIRDVLWVEILLIILLIYAIWKLSYSVGLWSSTEEGGGYSFSGLAFWKPVFCNWVENVYDIRRQNCTLVRKRNPQGGRQRRYMNHSSNWDWIKFIHCMLYN